MNFGKAKILFLDIETSPNIVAAWRCGYKLNIGTDSIIQERFMISAQWAWNNDRATGMLSNFKKADDKKLINTVRNEIIKADLIIGHNVRKFDLRWIEGRAFINGLKPTGSKFSPHLDTMILAKQAFDLNGYRMDYLSKLSGDKGKMSTSYSDWMEVLVNKDQARAEYLLKYGIKDIDVNRKLFKKILPYCKLPHHLGALISGDMLSCQACGSSHLNAKGYRTAVKSGTTYQRLVCADCGNNTQRETIKKAR